MNFFANAGIVLIVVLAGWVFLPFFPSFIWALVMAQVVRPIYVRTLRYFSPAVAATLMVVLVTLAVIIPLTLVGGKLVYEAADSYQAFDQKRIKNLSLNSVRNLVDRVPLPDTVRQILSPYELDEQMAITQAAEYGKKALQLFSGLATAAAMSAGGFLFTVVAFLVLFFFACMDGEAWYHAILRATPPRFGLESLFERMGTGASSLFWGVAGTCLLQGIAGGIVFLILGLPSPFLAGALMVICAMIPVVGTALVWAPVAIWLAITGAWGKALILTALGAGVIGTMDNITRPLLSNFGGAQMSVLTVTVGAIGGIAAYGLTGIIVGPLALEAFLWLLDHLGREREHEA
jgi:predicted PurR-regulated permease PerM